MNLDIHSLLCALMINLVTIALALPAVMGRVNLAARRAQWSMILQATGWALLLLSGTATPGSWIDRAMSSTAIACMSTSLVLLGSAFDRWFGRESSPAALSAVSSVLVVGYAAGFSNYAFRVGWANGLLALQLGWVAASICRKPRLPAGRWRWVLVSALLAQMMVTGWRGVLGAFFTQAYPRFLAPHPVNYASAMVSNATALLTLVAILLAHRDETARELERLATVDGLTGVFNRRAWFAMAEQLMAAGARQTRPMSVLMIDLDHFKLVNDTRGHEAGDRALRCVAQILQSCARAGDIVGRYGGEEFCVLMNDANDAAVRAFDQRLRNGLNDLAQRELGFALSYSAGVAWRVRTADTLDAMLQRADSALYRAKAQGRSRTLDELAAVVESSALPPEYRAATGAAPVMLA